MLTIGHEFAVHVELAFRAHFPLAWHAKATLRVFLSVCKQYLGSGTAPIHHIAPRVRLSSVANPYIS
jgi:hypothetical protein